jgi:uncharacterized membrane protein
MVTASNPSATTTVVTAGTTTHKLQSLPRLISVDMLRGLVMVIMALDHVRDYFTYLTFPPEDLSRTYGTLFFTRFITHYCAPVFFLLAGTGGFLAIARGKTAQEISRFYWTRGLWLVFLELTVISFGWSFTFLGFAIVIWALGWCMVAMGLIVRMPVRWVASVGIGMIVFHNLLDKVNPDSLGKFSALWMVFHQQGMAFIKPPTIGFVVLYPLIPWIGVMASGYALGALLMRPDRRKLLLRLGFGLTLAFFILRGINLYGNGTVGPATSVGPWSMQATFSLTVISFFNTLKYPPSLDYLLMTLGPALLVLAWFDGFKAERGLSRVLLVYGRVPMFYYVLHIYLIHSLAVIVAYLYHQPSAWLFHGAVFLNPVPAGYGHGLPFIYFTWIAVVALLYLPCRWFMEFKARHRDWSWLSYI